MARGKIQIKRIENTTNRQVTYSKRRNGLFKKAEELTVLCDAKVSVIMISSTQKIHEYISPGITTKQVVDLYQKASNTDVWSKQYERMQETLRKVKEKNKRLRTEIRQRMGECLNDLSFEELRGLEQDMDNAATAIRARKYKAIGSRTDTLRKKVRNVEEIYRKLNQELVCPQSNFEFAREAREEDRHYGLVDNSGDYESVIALGPRVFALHLNPNQSANMQSCGGSDLTYTLMSGN
uniref:Uncharacterized protein n=1 Tax=Kalanchoe fedtschenkoi TaxID=63787 RepID=A0A7N0R9P5_KALFE